MSDAFLAFRYELQGPIYFNPDVIADFTNVTFTSDGANRVRIRNVKGLPAPPTLKVAVQTRGGYQAEFSVHPVGLDIQEKFESFKTMTNLILKQEIANGDISVLEYQLYGSVMDDPTSQQKATTQMR
jgi:Acyclic terpene utilisation family protein AtuA